MRPGRRREPWDSVGGEYLLRVPYKARHSGCPYNCLALQENSPHPFWHSLRLSLKDVAK